MQATVKPAKFDSVFDCPRCDGKGYIREFSHIANGKCFLCAGAKQIAVTSITPKVAEAKTGVRYIKRDLWPRGPRNPSVISERIEVYMNGRLGQEVVFDAKITDSNREELRGMWAWLVANGATADVIDETK